MREFYQEAFDHDSDSTFPQLSSGKVRRELFKLFYESGEFQLHDKADAFETLDQLLGILHGSSAS